MVGYRLYLTPKKPVFKKRFSEHGIVLGIMSVLPTTAYQNGVDRYWRKVTDRYDYEGFGGLIYFKLNLIQCSPR